MTGPEPRSHISRRLLTAACGILISASDVSRAAPAAEQTSRTARPNILLILVDDVGYCDVGAFAARIRDTTTDRLFYETPGIDRLAAEGTMFTQFPAVPFAPQHPEIRGSVDAIPGQDRLGSHRSPP